MATPNPVVQPIIPSVRNRPTSGRGAQIANPPTNTPQNYGNVTPLMITVPDVKIEELSNWLADLYDVTKFTDSDIKAMYEAFSYKGFNRMDVLKQLFSLKDRKIVIQLIIVSALRGPQASALIKLSNGQTPAQMGIPASGAQGTKALTMNRIASATADLAAYFLKKMDVPKRMDLDLPGWLQFPTAGGIRLPTHYREIHREFSRRFSGLIGGIFQEQIYFQMEANSYLDPKLKLFD